jgi:hypothetical protein
MQPFHENQQFMYYMTHEKGDHIPFHRQSALMAAAGSVSYTLAKSKLIEIDPFVLNKANVLYTAEIKYKDIPCGVVYAEDMTDYIHIYRHGVSPYFLGVFYYPEWTKYDCLPTSDGKLRTLPPFDKNHLRIQDHLTIFQNLAENKPLYELPNFEAGLMECIKPKYTFFRIPGTL